MSLRQIHNPSGAYSSFFDSSASESRNSPKMACSAFFRTRTASKKVLITSESCSFPAEFDLSLPPQSLLVERNPSAATCVSGRRLHILYLAELSAINKARIFYCAGCIMFLGALRTATFHSRHQGICCFICNGTAIAFALPKAYTPFPSGRVLVRSTKYSQASDMLPGQII